MSSHASAVTIGSFDGVHLGHRRLVGELARVGGARGLAAVVLTFDRHPASVVRPGSAPLLLTDLEQRIELLEAAGADEVRVLPFDEARAAEEADDFVRGVLAGDLGAQVVMVGRDFHFGHGRRGTVELLRDMGGELGFEVIAYELVPDPEAGEVVSSTRIRNLLASGEVEEAARLLGRPHELRGAWLPPDGGEGAALLAVPPDIAVPAAGRYRVEVAPDDPQTVPADATVAVAVTGGQDERGESVVELHAPPGGTLAAPSREGRARVRFLGTAARSASAEGDDLGIRAGD